MIKELNEYKEFEKATKKLINKINNDIIKIDIDCRKISKNMSIILNREEKINIKL